jgi:hypothetical protein
VQPLFSYLQQHNIAYESRVFPTQGHKFKPAELEDVRTLAIEFFQQHLKPAVSAKRLRVERTAGSVPLVESRKQSAR